MADEGARFYINWASVPVFLVLAIAIAMYAEHVSGGWMRPWLGTKPVWWFFLLLLVPPLGYLHLVVNLFVYRHTPEAITGRHAVR